MQVGNCAKIINVALRRYARRLTKRSGVLENKKVFGAQAEVYYPGYYYNKAGNYLV